MRANWRLPQTRPTQHGQWLRKHKRILDGYALLNGMLFNYLGIQLSVLGRKETFQTVGGIVRAMKQARSTRHPAGHIN